MLMELMEPKRRRLLHRETESHKVTEPFESHAGEAKEQSFLVITTIILLFVVGVAFMGYAYHCERSMRLFLETENNLNTEIIQACGRMQVMQEQLEKDTLEQQLIIATPDCPACKCVKVVPAEVTEAPTPPPGPTLEDVQKEIDTAHGAKAELVIRNMDVKAGIQKASQELLLLKFGPEPYFVEFTLEYSIPGQESPHVGVLQFQMAPMAEMPYSVLYFLTHVIANSWNGCSFVGNLGHILLALPVAIENGNPPLDPTNTKDEKCSILRFQGSDVMGEHLAFQEYSKSYPHKQYTLGFSGKPGGPDFYISLKDNTVAHGPSLDGKIEPDSCFATLVSGREEIEKINEISPSLSNGANHFFTDKYIIIQKAAIVTV